MTNSTAATRYARALLDVAVREKTDVDQIERELASFVDLLAKLLGLLAERDRLVLVPALLAAYRDRLLEFRHVVRAEVTTTVPLAPERAKNIEASLARLTGRTVALSTKVDPALIGGVVTRIGSTVYDASVTRHLERMKEKLAWT